MLAALPRVSTVIDVGANNGQFSLLSRRLWSDAEIFAIEPNPSSTTRLTRLFRRDSGIKVFTCAVGSVAGRAHLHVHNEADSSSLLRSSPLQESLFGTSEKLSIPVSVRRLDDLKLFCGNPTLMKLDVQGYELEVLRGATETLTHCDYVLVEVSHVPFYVGQPDVQSVVGFLAEAGLPHVRAKRPTVVEGEVVQEDILVSRRASESS